MTNDNEFIIEQFTPEEQLAYERAMQRLTSRNDDNNWQSITTAPKDGTKVWVYGCFDGAEHGFMATAHYCTQDDYGDRWIFVGMNPGTWKYKLAHWKPLPEPPEGTP
jgi:hypothetical protein